MERARPLADIFPETRAEGSDRRTPVGKRRESGVETKRHPLRYFEIEDRASGTPEFAVRTDPETGLVVFVDGRDAPEEAAAHVANDIFAVAEYDLKTLAMDREAVSTGDAGAEIFRPRRTRAEDLLASASENALAERDLLLRDVDLRARGDRETALELPASVALAVIPERISEEEIVGADKDTAEALVGRKTLNADEMEWKSYLGKYVDEERRLRKDYETSKERLKPLLDRAGRYLKGGEAAKFLEGGQDDLLMSLKRGAADFLARFEKEQAPDAVTEMRRLSKKEHRQGKKTEGYVYQRIARLPIYSAAEKTDFYKHKASQHDWGNARSVVEELTQQREELAAVRGLLQELRSNMQNAEARVEKILQTGEPPLASDERALLAEAAAKEQIIRDPGLLARLREPDLRDEERATIGALEDALRERQESVAAVMASDAFRGLSRPARYTLAERLKERLPEEERLRLLETRAASISGRLGNGILVYRLRNGHLEPLHDAMNRRGQETLKLRGLERPVRANQTARESFAAEFGDAFVILPAEHAQLRADATLAAAKDPEGALRQMADQERYPMVRVTVLPPAESAVSPALDRADKAS
ncbi:hypothetical protein EPO33_05370 [Patescibacteria group bacterium]|nr:MAG: hypothetical protein EPO33_05370 [Patescibacteria group bacterium]